MSDKEFEEKVKKGLAEAKQDLSNTRSRIKNPKYHENRVGNALKGAITELREMSDEVNMIQELLGIIDQVPAFVGAAWPENEVLANQLEGRISAWQDVENQLSDHVQAIEKQKLADEIEDSIEEKKEEFERMRDLAAKVESGEISEPTKMSSIRRSPGTRPESLSSIRKAQQSLKQLQNELPKDSEG
tara:strand:+ start:1535 stop:2095 length:561 start_codon:yes stop_codon:yes gene_type:complete